MGGNEFKIFLKNCSIGKYRHPSNKMAVEFFPFSKLRLREIKRHSLHCVIKIIPATYNAADVQNSILARIEIPERTKNLVAKRCFRGNDSQTFSICK